jgi:hypothetical protein
MSDDYDTPWKNALTRYFPEFMAFYFPEACRDIDWTVPWNFLEQELAQVVRDAELGSRRVDKLVRVVKRGGAEEWVLVHVDVQGKYDRKFAERIFIYNYRIYDRYRRPVASLAVLADGNRKWRPSHFSYSLLGCEMRILFPAVKLTDYSLQLDELLIAHNVFALVTAAHLLTQQTRGQQVKRYEAKRRLARLLYVRSWSKQQIIDLFSVIDWLMQIPAQLQKQLWHELRELEKDREMPYMNMFEKFGREQGLEEGRKEGRKAALSEILEVQLEKRFGDLPPHVRDRLQQAEAVDLLAWAAALVDAPSLDRVFFRSQAS